MTPSPPSPISLATGVKVIKDKLKTLPLTSGVYRMLDEKGTVLYVGKAKSLKKRVDNYTHPEKLSARIQMMVARTRDLVIVTTKTEAEAFLLENEFIKGLKPYYNILLRDDKSFPYILLTEDEAFPKLVKYRGTKRDKGEYFGPFASAEAVNTTLKVLEKVFLLRSCKDSYMKGRSNPCILYQIKRCSAPCTGLISAAEYAARIKEAKEFLKGKSSLLQKKLQTQMEALSAAKQYEDAAVIRDRLKALNQISGQSFADLKSDAKLDIIALYTDGFSAAVQILFIRNGMGCGSYSYFYKDIDGLSPADIMESFLSQFYKSREVPPELVLNLVPTEAEVISQGLATRLNTSPIRGRKKLLEDAILNAKSYLERRKLETSADKKIWDELADLVGLTPAALSRIEIYDNSHISGTNAVGAMVVASIDGFKKSAYRRFNIKTKGIEGDDYAMMKEVLTRRLSRGDDLPSLIIIDGGKGQLHEALAVRNSLGLSHKIKMIGIAKGENRNAGEETLILENRDSPLKLAHTSPLLFYLQRLRDEAHRFAIGSHRARREKSAFINPLDDIEGIGKVKKKSLLSYFGSAKAVSSASVFELEKVPHLTQKDAEKVFAFFHT